MSARRVLVLARAGIARDHAEAALLQAGAELAASLDPLVASEDELRAAAADAVLVVLDSATEAALEKFDALLADPALEVLYDDAEVAGKREGWEAARWARHLAAKLQGHQNVLPAVHDETAASDFAAEMQALQQHVEALPPELPAVAATRGQGVVEGAVVIVAGVGGPDAVRQLLSDLPATFSRPVVLRQRIDGGQYDRLQRQMQRATQMPVVMAQPNEPLRPGMVHVLGDGVDVRSAPAGLHFAEASGEPRFAALRPAESALLLLSGADVNLVDAAMALRWAGGLVLGQAIQNCFDPAASQALVARGGEARSLTEISRQLLQRWTA